MALQKERLVADLQRLNNTIVASEKRVAEQRLRIKRRTTNKVALSTLEQSQTLLNQLEDSLNLYKRRRQLLIALLADSNRNS